MTCVPALNVSAAGPDEAFSFAILELGVLLLFCGTLVEEVNDG